MNEFKKMMQELLKKENNEKLLMVVFNEKIYPFRIKYITMHTLNVIKEGSDFEKKLIWSIY